MTASLIPVSHGEPMIFKKDESTAAERTWVFFLTNTADGSVATGKTIATTDFKISKAGGAFGNAVGVVTEISLGWYKMVFDAGDVDTIGALACELSGEAGVDPIHCVHQIVAVDFNDTVRQGLTALANAAIGATGGGATEVIRGGTAQDGSALTITLDAGASAVNDLYKGDAIQITGGTGAGQTNRIAGYVGATKVATVEQAWATNPANDSVFEITRSARGLATAAALASLASQVATVAVGVLPARNTTHALGTQTTAARTSTAKGIAHIVDAAVVFTGTFGASASMQVQTTEDGTAWTDYGTPATAAGSVAITEPHKGVRAVLADGNGSTAVVTTLNIRTNA